MLQIGSVLDGKYRILSEIGHGGMSVVYLAINQRANKTWAIKEVRKDGVMNFESVRQGLVAETDMLKKLNHPHLPSIIDVIDQDDSFLIVMDYIEGRSLQSVLNKSGAQSVDAVIDWGKQICDVLGYLHSRVPPIVYRDMKPANLMLEPKRDTSDTYKYGKLMLIDFGTAREFKYRSKVEDTTCLGTRGYAAPEQFGGLGETDARTDIYCTGATMYHLITGHSPADPPYEIKPLRYWNSIFADTGIEKVIDKCCRQDPNDRYQSCEELMYALENVGLEDRQAVRSRRTKWLAFILSIAMCILGGIGMVVSGIAGNNARADSYDYYLKQAASADSFESRMVQFDNAIDVEPGRPEAYEQLIETIARNGMDTQEYSALKRCLLDSNDGITDNSQRLQAYDRDAADRIFFQVGILYYFMYDNSNNTRSQASSYFAEVENSDALTPTQRELASCLVRIGKYYEGLGNKGNIYYSGGDTYATLWADLKEMLSGDVMEKVGNDAYGIALCDHMAYQIFENYKNFSSNGVTKQDMLTELDVVETVLNSRSYSDVNLLELQEDALRNISEARKTVNSYYTT